MRLPCACALGLLLATAASAQEPITDAAVESQDAGTLFAGEPLPAEPPAPRAEQVAEGPVAEEQELSAEELENLGFGGAAPSVDTDIKVFGFADFTLSVAPQKPGNAWRQATAPHSSFYVGNFNLYLSKNLSENVRTMSEVRFHYAPHGSQQTSGAYNISAAGDPADFNRVVHWGGIEIERIYIEWTIHPYLTARAGQFLTPYGIWNVDHGSPVYIPVSRPYVIGSALFPERQTGFEFLGKYDLNEHSALGYHFTLSNGMGPVSEVRDLDENKGVGARLFWEYRRWGTLRVGGSAFYAKDTSLTPTQSLDGSGRLTNRERLDAQSKVLSLAADLQWKLGGLHIQAEFLTQQRSFSERGRVASVNPFTNSPIFPQDYLSWGVYGLAGYGIDIWNVNIMPYLLVQSFDQLDPTFIKTKTNGATLGVNLRPIDAVVVKLAYAMSRFPHGFVVSDGTINLVQAQIAWAF
jgi:hypothetical protein